MIMTMTVTMTKVMNALVRAVAAWVLMTAMLLMMMYSVDGEAGDRVKLISVVILLLRMLSTLVVLVMT